MYKTKLNALRKERNLSTADIGKIVGVSSAAIGTWCSGKYCPSDEYIPKLASALDVPLLALKSMLSEAQTAFKNSMETSDSGEPNKSVVDMRSSHTFKDNFWSRKRVECDMKIKEVGEAINQPLKRVGQYFTGQALPNDDIIHDLCDLFDVDFVTGKREFINANKIWVGEHDKDLVSCKRVNKQKKATVKGDELKELDNPTKTLDVDTINYIATKIYGKVDYQEFTRIIDLLSLGTELSKLLDMVYGRVDFNVFMLLDDLSRGIDIEPPEPEF
jgi:transcriptional regulator with XRE-family HTH domain